VPVKRFRFLIGLAMIVSACSPSPAQRTQAMQFSGVNQALERAIEADDASAVDTAIAAGASANARGLHGVTPLSYAIGIEKKKAVSALLRHRADPNLRDDQKYSPVSLAVDLFGKDKWYLDQLLGAGGNPNITGPDGDPVISLFVAGHNLEAISWLHARGADINLEINEQPMIVTASIGVDWDVTLRLIELGARLDTKKVREGMIFAFKAPELTPMDSPLYPAKVEVWRRLRAAGIDATPPEGIDADGTASAR
jgi:uncharacterized protein